MRELLNAFLELPMWQGILLITSSVGFVTLLCLWVSRLAYRRGWRNCEADSSRRFNERLHERYSVLR